MRPVSIHPLSVREQLQGKRLLVTGVTGFLGKVWALSLLQDLPEIGSLVLLARGNGSMDALRRVEHHLGSSPAMRPLKVRHGSNLAAFLAERIEVLPGDVALPMAGLSTARLHALRGTVDLVVHFAGLTDFQPDPTEAVDANVQGALHVADVAHALGVPLVHVSTAYVAGRRDGRIEENLDPQNAPNGDPLDPERELAALRDALAATPAGRAGKAARIDIAAARAAALGWPNIYTYTKALAERLLALRPSPSVTLVRPSIVECARAFPFAGWNEGVNTSAPLAWLISTPFRDFPSRGHHHFDIAPVDLVARGMTLICADVLAGRGGGVFHLGTSGSNPVTFDRIIELTGLANRRRLREDSSASAVDRLLVPHLDPVAVDANRRPLWHVSRVRKGLRATRSALEQLSKIDLPTPLRDSLGAVVRDLGQAGTRATRDADRLLGRVETMLELFQPFVHDQDYIFANDRVRALSAALPPEEREQFRFDDDTIDWRHYWYDVQYPGLWVWSIPLLQGKTAPIDAEPSPVLVLPQAAPERLIATASPERVSGGTA